MQLKAAEGGNVTMLIWLGKQLLGQKDKSELTGKDDTPLVPPESTSTRDIARAIIDVLREAKTEGGE